MKIDYVALQVEKPAEAASWYCENFGASLIYSDDTWAFIEFENIKLAFVIADQHPSHIAFEDKSLESGKLHRDGSRSVYKMDPFGNFYEIIKYKENNESKN